MSSALITGFNTDIEYNGVVYHVQTEDKGLETPLILSLIYTGGQILASKRTSYDDLLVTGFDERSLSERLQKQHKILCAAIKTGRIDDLIRLSQRETERNSTSQSVCDPEAGPEINNLPAPEQAPKEMMARLSERAQPPHQLHGEPELHSLKLPALERPNFGPSAFLLLDPPPLQKISLCLRDEPQFIAGGLFTVEIGVRERSQPDAQLLSGINVTAKVLGTSFRPLVFMAQTNSDGWATLHLSLPVFRTGRAAILFRAEIYGQVAELRRIILAQKSK